MSINSINNYGATGASGTSNTTGGTTGSNTLNMDDFFKLMAAQLSNQDMYNTVDDSQFLAQMAQFSMVSALNELSKASSTSYGVSLIGKEVTLASNNADGTTGAYKGIVEGVNLFNGNTQIVVDGEAYPLSSVLQVAEPEIIIPNNTVNNLQAIEPTNENNTADKTENSTPTNNSTPTDTSSATDNSGSTDAGSSPTDETGGGGGV